MWPRNTQNTVLSPKGPTGHAGPEAKEWARLDGCCIGMEVEGSTAMIVSPDLLSTQGLKCCLPVELIAWTHKWKIKFPVDANGIR